MRDLDDLLADPGFAGDVSDGLGAPDFQPVRAAGVRRARRRRALAAGATALAVGAVVGGVWLGTSSGDDPAAPAGTPGETPSELAPTPDRTEQPDQGRGELLSPMAPEPAWLEGDRAYLYGFALDPAGNSTASLWVCQRECDGQRTVLVVATGARRSVFPVKRGRVVATEEGRFVVEPFGVARWPRLFDVDGEVAIAVEDGESPLRAGEALVSTAGSGLRYLGLFGVDGSEATMHAASVPATIGLRSYQADGLDLTLESERGFWISDDGGASGTLVEVDRDELHAWLVPSAEPGTRVVLLGSDGASLFPVQRVVRLLPDGTSLDREVQLDSPYVLAPMVRADGKLVLVTTGPDVGDGLRVVVGEPGGVDLREIAPIGFEDAVDMRGTISTPDGPMLVADTADRDRVLVSADGEVWKSVRTR